MSNTLDDGDRAVRRAYIERTLAHYPDLDRDRIEEVRQWFRKEASSLDVGLVATNQEIAEGYRRFRADHIDRLTGADVLRGIAFAAAVALIIALIVWRGL